MGPEFEALQNAETKGPAAVQKAARALDLVLTVAAAEAPTTSVGVAYAQLEQGRAQFAETCALRQDIRLLREDIGGLRGDIGKVVTSLERVEAAVRRAGGGSGGEGKSRGGSTGAATEEEGGLAYEAEEDDEQCAA